MSLMGTLGKVAMGVIVAKGVGKVMGGAGGGGGGLGGLLGGLTGGASSGGGGLGGLLGGLTGGNNAQAGGGGGLGGLLGGLTGGSQGGQSGGLGGMLGGLMGGNNAQAGAQGNQASAGGLGGLLAGLSGQGQSGAAAGGLGGLLGSLGGASAPQQQGGSSPTDFGAMFNDALQGKEPEQVSDTDEQNAAVLLRAMISAAKADGELDSEEQRKITEHLGDVSEEEAAFVRHELAAPLDLDGLVASVPSGLEQQVYLMSLMAIDLDSKEEAVYLDSLRKGLNITEQASNHIHDQLGAPQLYS